VTAELAEVEDFPWESSEPFIPRTSVSTTVVAAVPVEVLDFPMDGERTDRVTVVRLGDVSVHVGLSGGDEEVIAECDRILSAFTELQTNAADRIEART
jgi:hypothetical protein